MFIQPVFAWNHSVSIGVGKSHDPNDIKHYNSGVLLSGDLIPLKRYSWSFWTVNGALGRWYSTAPVNKNLTTLAAALAVRLYPNIGSDNYKFYGLLSAGPAYLSSKQFGVNDQGSNLSGQWLAGIGFEHQQFDINFRYIHFSNAHLASPDQGFNIQYLLSVGYLF
jgi:hypothetical protein